MSESTDDLIHTTIAKTEGGTLYSETQTGFVDSFEAKIDELVDAENLSDEEKAIKKEAYKILSASKKFANEKFGAWS